MVDYYLISMVVCVCLCVNSITAVKSLKKIKQNPIYKQNPISKNNKNIDIKLVQQSNLA